MRCKFSVDTNPGIALPRERCLRQHNRQNEQRAPAAKREAGEAALDAALDEALATLSVKDAAREVARRLGLPRREVYARALELVPR